MSKEGFKSVANTDARKYQEARNTLPADLQSIYDELVANYASFTFQKYGRGYVAYKAMAESVREGWRPSARSE